MSNVADGQLTQFQERVRQERTFFDGSGAVTVARAPGRLDVMGGVADYSGSVVLEGTIAEGTFAGVQTRTDNLIRLRTLDGDPGLQPLVEVSLDSLLERNLARPAGEVAASLKSPTAARWAAYAVGCYYYLLAAELVSPKSAAGVNILVQSSVPIGAGVSSSAALEVATMSALRAHFGLEIPGMNLAHMCQQVENKIAGAPCGIMDQVTCALGREDELLVLKCQPHDLLGYARIPQGWEFVGLDSGVKHSVGGSNYTRARVGAFMGLQIVSLLLAQRGSGGYLCNLSAQDWKELRSLVPESLTGKEFTERHGSYPDKVTTVDPLQTYRVRMGAEHPILENERVLRFIDLMRVAEASPDEQLLRQAGSLMLDAHKSYSERLDLGSPETDLLVELAMGLGPEHGIYGAKITGGGSGGTVVLLCSGERSRDAVEKVRSEYQRKTGILPTMMRGSSPGAEEFGTMSLKL